MANGTNLGKASPFSAILGASLAIFVSKEPIVRE
jgi:hypothetical protein